MLHTFGLPPSQCSPGFIATFAAVTFSLYSNIVSKAGIIRTGAVLGVMECISQIAADPVTSRVSSLVKYPRTRIDVVNTEHAGYLLELCSGKKLVVAEVRSF